MKQIFKIIVAFIFFIFVLLLWYDQSRSFYCIANKKCITVWKRIGGSCYIIPDKYYGVIKPLDCFIKTVSTQYLTIYMYGPALDTLVVRDDGTSTGDRGDFKIKNNFKYQTRILNYRDSLYNILYKPNAVNHNDVKAGVELIYLDILEGYATNKLGEKIK